jgi:AcrR family transcriptional regulator
MDLYVSRGFEETTAADIAQAVGLTERTFFRHFADKREVLFDGQETLQAAFVDAITQAPPGTAPLELIGATVAAAATFFTDERRSYSRARSKIISENPALQERELLKLAGLAAAVCAALRARGVREPTARLAAESGGTVFSVSFRTWIAEGEERSFLEIGHEVLGALVALTTGAVTLAE